MRRFLVTLLAALALCAPADARESMGITVSHSLSATTPDNPAFEIQPKHWNSNHIATINAVGSEISGAFGNGGGVTFGLSGDGNVTAAAPAQTVQTQNFVAVIASGANGNGTFTSGTLSIKAGNNVTLSTGANVISIHAPAPGAAAEANAINLLGANTAGSTTATGSTIGWSGINVTLSGTNDSQVVISAAAPKTGISGIIVSDATYTSGTVSFSNAGNITISSSVNGASQYIVLSGNAAQTVQSQNFVAVIASGGNGNGTFTSGTVSFKNGSNITFSTGANVISVFAPDSQTVQTQNLFVEIVSGANGNLTASSGTLSVKAGNNITLSTGAGVYSIHGAAAQTNQSAIKAFGVSNTGATAGNTGVSTGIDWVLAGSNLLTLSQSTAVGGPNTVWIQHPAWLTTARGSTDAIGLNTAKTNVTWTANSSGLSFDAGGYAGTGFTTATTAGTALVGTHNTAGLSMGVPAWLTAAAGGANLTLQDSATTLQVTKVIYSNLNGVSFGLNTAASIATVTASVAAQSNQTVGLYATGNTTNNSSTTFDARTLGSWNAQGAATVGFSNGSVQLSVPATSSLVGINGISISTAGSTISVMPQWISSYENFDNCGSNTMTLNAASVSHAVAFYLPQPISGSFIRFPVLMTTNSTTIATMASATATASGNLFSTWNAVIYSLGIGGNSQSLQSVASGSGGFTFQNRISITNSTQYSITQAFSAQANGAGTTRTTQYSISNTNYSFTTNQIATEWSSGRFMDIPFASSLSPGPYWLVFGYSSSSNSAGAAGLAALTNCNVRYSNHYAVSQVDIAFGIMGSTNLTSGGLIGAGSFSTAGGGTTNSLPISAISSSASQVRPYFQILRSA